MRFLKEMCRLYAVTDRACLRNGLSLAAAVELSLKGGVSMLQFREKELRGEERLREALSVQKVCKDYSIPFIVNDDVELAAEISADGVHIGQEDMDIRAARLRLGDSAIIGVTAKTVEQAVYAESGGADYLGSGAVFSSSTKPGAVPLSFDGLSRITHSVNIPVVAIGGIDLRNASALMGLGLSGIALVRGIFGEEDIEESSRRLATIAAGL